MESKKGVDEQKRLKRKSYSNRKECIKKKTMELATLCGIDACTVMVGADGEIESWPENPNEAKAVVKKFKDLISNPHKRTTVKDESRKKAVGVEAVYCQENLAQVKAEIVTIARMEEKSSMCLRPSLLTGYQECLKQVDSKLEALIKRIESLRADQEHDRTRGCMVNKQLDYSEENKRLNYPESTSPKRRKVSEEAVLLFDLNLPPPDEPEASSLSFEDCNFLPNQPLRIG